MLGCTHAAAVGGPYDQRGGCLAPGTGADLAGLGHQLVGALIEKAHELDLGDRSQPGQCHAESRTDNG